MDYQKIVSLVKKHCALLANQYRQDKDELFSYVLAKIPGLVNRMDTKGYTEIQCLAYVKKSVRGYCLHYIRDKAPLIRTPRNCKPLTCQTLLDTDYIPNDGPHPSLPWYILQIMEDPNLTKRISNAYLRYFDT